MTNTDSKTTVLLQKEGMDKFWFDQREKIVEQCEGCSRIEEINSKRLCLKYMIPSFHWENDQICAFATHIKKEFARSKKRTNPLKASKRMSRKTR